MTQLASNVQAEITDLVSTQGEIVAAQMGSLANSSLESARDPSSGNPFEMIAFLLFTVRHSLEDIDSIRAPRWVRISRARSAQSEGGFIGEAEETLGNLVKSGINLFAGAVSDMVSLTLALQDFLIQADAAKALTEGSIELMNKAVSKDFQDGVKQLTGIQVPRQFELATNVLQKLEKGLNSIPGPDDLDGIGHELYRLLCIELLPSSQTSEQAAGDEIVSIDKSGKVRLLQWAFGKGLVTQVGSEEVTLSQLGSRRLREAQSGQLPEKSSGYWKEGEHQETIFDFSFDEEGPDDIEEAHKLLDELGYTAAALGDAGNISDDDAGFGPVLARKLRRFQVINDLPVTGELDNDTVNRLMNLDFRARNLKRAKPFDPDTELPEDIDEITERSGTFAIVNGDADDPGSEEVDIVEEPPEEAQSATNSAGEYYPYYIVGTQARSEAISNTSPPRGWIRDTEDNHSQDSNTERLTQGFVALKSRYFDRTTGEYAGGNLSEGEAAYGGGFFFAARHVEPWLAGRDGAPHHGALFQSNAAAQGRPLLNTISRIYQWVSIEEVKGKKPSGYDLWVTGSVLLRSLFRERSVDQGRLVIEFYGNDEISDWLRPPSAGAKTETHRKHTDWFPDVVRNEVIATTKLENATLKRNWTLRWLNIAVPDDAASMLVILEGRVKNPGGWDIDAYFDDVQVTWEYRKS